MAELIRKRTKYTNITVGIICGSGFGGIAESVKNADYIPYEDVPGLPISTGKTALILFFFVDELK